MALKLTDLFIKSKGWVQWLVLSVAALVLYAPVIGNYFVNDDLMVLKKVCIDRQLNTKGFFRPLSDITLFGNFLLSGFNAAGYHITNILVHALNAWLLFFFFLRWRWTNDDGRQQLFAVLSALFFLTYPFHNEPVVWILGRASLLASTFAFLAMAILVSRWREAWKITGAAICYFIAMTGYESVFVLPAIIFIYLVSQKASLKRIFVWMLVMAVMLAAHFIIRIQVSGSVTGVYGGAFVDKGLTGPLVTAAKTAGRLLVPPVKQPVVFIALSLVAFVVLLAGVIRFWKKNVEQKNSRTYLLYLSGMLLLALLLPFVAGVSTNSSESDRFLYFPSYFLCPLFALLLVRLWYYRRLLNWVVPAILIYNIIFLELNNQNWRKASVAVTDLLALLKDRQAGDGKTYVINLPDEIDGAFVFRVGLSEALQVNGIDTASVKAVSPAVMRELAKLPAIEPRTIDGGVYIAPNTLVVKNRLHFSAGENKYSPVFVSAADRVIYWNKYRWVVMD